jgi:hypothetical protein
MRHSARFERHETEMPQQRSGVVNGSMDESARPSFTSCSASLSRLVRL